MGRSIATDSSGHGFASFNEVKEANGARDRAQQEIFLCENKVALQELPLDELFDAWDTNSLSDIEKERKQFQERGHWARSLRKTFHQQNS